MGAYLMVYHKDADHSLHMALSRDGLEHYCCRMDYERQTYEFVQEIPTFETVVGTEGMTRS